LVSVSPGGLAASIGAIAYSSLPRFSDLDGSANRRAFFSSFDHLGVKRFKVGEGVLRGFDAISLAIVLLLVLLVHSRFSFDQSQFWFSVASLTISQPWRATECLRFRC
jgi:hypothetical protein